MNKYNKIILSNNLINESLLFLEDLVGKSNEYDKVINEIYISKPIFHENDEVLEDIIGYICESLNLEDTIVGPNTMHQDVPVEKVDKFQNKFEKINDVFKYSSGEGSYQRSLGLLYLLAKIKDHNLAKDELWRKSLMDKFEDLSNDEKEELEKIIDGIIVDSCNEDAIKNENINFDINSVIDNIELNNQNNPTIPKFKW